MSNELYHHGIKGMKWGVRRYQNYDGSYTQKGLKRYHKAEQDYEAASRKAQEAKQAYKSYRGTKQDYKAAKYQARQAKRELDKSYDRLKFDKRADEGKKLYKQGKTITENNQRAKTTSALIVMGSSVASYALHNGFGDEPIAHVAGNVVVSGAAAVNTILGAKTVSENRKLRAYYAHN